MYIHNTHWFHMYACVFMCMYVCVYTCLYVWNTRSDFERNVCFQWFSSTLHKQTFFFTYTHAHLHTRTLWFWAKSVFPVILMSTHGRRSYLINPAWANLLCSVSVCRTAILIIIDVRYQLSTVFSTSLLLENRWNHDNGRQLLWEWQNVVTTQLQAHRSLKVQAATSLKPEAWR